MSEPPKAASLMLPVTKPRIYDILETPEYLRFNHELNGMIAGQEFRAAANELGLPLNGTDEFANIIIEGPHGSGKTTLATAAAGKLAREGFIGEGKIWLVRAAQLIGDFVGWSGSITNSVLDAAKGGILIIDDFHDVLSNSQFADAALGALNGYMSTYVNNPIIIATCYADTYRKITQANQGFNGRFPNYWEIAARNDTRVADMLLQKFTMDGMIVNPGVEKACHDLVTSVQSKKQGQFAAAREVGNIYRKVIDLIGLRVRDSHPQLITAVKNLSPEDKAALKVELSQVFVSDIPTYDPVLKAYVPSVPVLTCAPEHPAETKVVAFPGKVPQPR